MSFRQMLAVAMLVAVGVAYAQTTDPQAEPALHETQHDTPVTEVAEVDETAAAADEAASEADADAEPEQEAATESDMAEADEPAPAADDGMQQEEAPAAPAAAAAAVQSQVLFGDAEAGAGKAAVCAACHGQDGNASIEMYPKLAGQNEAYVVRQLKLYQSGERSDPVMSAFAAPLSVEDMHDLGAYFALQTPTAGVADDALVERGRQLYHGGDAALDVPACMACHGPDGGGMAGSGYPHLSGQWADYSAKTLRAWKDGVTWGDSSNARIMPEIVARLSDDDIAALSSYMEGLHTAQPGTR